MCFAQRPVVHELRHEREGALNLPVSDRILIEISLRAVAELKGFFLAPRAVGIDDVERQFDELRLHWHHYAQVGISGPPAGSKLSIQTFRQFVDEYRLLNPSLLFDVPARSFVEENCRSVEIDRRLVGCRGGGEKI